MRRLQTILTAVVLVGLTTLTLDARPSSSDKRRAEKRAEKARLEAQIEHQIHDEIHDLAKKCFNSNAYGLSYRLVRRILDENPDHRTARKTLGYVSRKINKKDHWLRPYGVRQLGKGVYWDRDFGWVPVKRKDSVPDDAMVFSDGKWWRVDALDERQAKSGEPYEIETEHFILRSSADYLRSVEIANALEDYHEEVFRVYVGFFVAGKRQLTLFHGLKKKLVVRFFADEDEYEEFVEKEYADEPKERDLLLESGGFYSTNKHQSFFYDREDGDIYQTLFHETAHQILGETSDRGTKCPTWVSEGAAVYMESVDFYDDKLTFDLSLNNRIVKASASTPRKLSELFQLDEEFHGSRRSANYSFAGIAVAFFCEYENGMYREDFCEYLRMVYEKKPEDRTVDSFIGVELAVLEGQFEEYWKALGESL